MRITSESILEAAKTFKAASSALVREQELDELPAGARREAKFIYQTFFSAFATPCLGTEEASAVHCEQLEETCGRDGSQLMEVRIQTINCQKLFLLCV